MTEIKQNTAHPLQIFASDANGAPVLGITDGQWTKRISKGGSGAFSPMTITITEDVDGWYDIVLSASHTDTLGFLACYFKAAGTLQVNIQFQVVSKLAEDLDVATFPAGANQFTETVTNILTTLPLAGVTVWISTDSAANNVIWSGNTDSFGVARDVLTHLPMLDAGTYYFWFQKAGYLFASPSSHVVSPLLLTGADTGTPVPGGFISSGFISTFRRNPTYLTLERYAQQLGIAESALYGISREDDPDMGCPDYLWNETMRQQMLRAIQMAEGTLEKTIKSPLKLTWFCDESYVYRNPIVSIRRGRVISIGTKTEVAVAAGLATGVANVAEEYELVCEVDFTECKEVVVYYPGQTKWEIHPSKIEISGTTLTVTIPRPRLLLPEYFRDFKSPDDHPHFEDDVFLEQVDIYRRYPDTRTAVTFLWRRRPCGCRTLVCQHNPNPGDITTQTGVGTIVDARLGNVMVEPALLNSETGLLENTQWTICGRKPDAVLISYVAGINDDCDGNCPIDDDPELARAIIALAHSNLPMGVCSCGPAQIYYESDSYVTVASEGPTILSPFGITRGQNLAWQIAKRNAIGMGGLFA